MAKPPRFEKFVTKLTSTNSLPVLPLTHGTTAFGLRDIVNEGELKVNMCDTLQRDLIFTFYGRPSYRPKDAEKSFYQNVGAPVFLILSPDLIAKSDLAHPFDSGADKLGLYKPHFGEKAKLSDFSFNPSQNSLKALIEKFYGDNKAYMSNLPKNDAGLSGDEFEAKAYHASLMDGRREGAGDERASSIEITLYENVTIRRKHVKLAVIPDVLADSGETIDKLNAIGFPIETYSFRPGLSWSDYMALIYDLVENWYKIERLL